MIYDVRIYTFQPGKLAEFFKIYEAEGLPVQTKHLGSLFAFLQSHIGPLNQILHIWAYESLAEREARRAKLTADPAWQAYLAKSQPLIQHMENRIMTAAPFWPLAKG
jgi:hypothetical protein